MLYNPGWQKPSLASFVAWLETKNPKHRYKFVEPIDCACGKYAQEVVGLVPGTPGWLFGRWSSVFFDLEQLAEAEPHTYGACLERAREALNDRA